MTQQDSKRNVMRSITQNEKKEGKKEESTNQTASRKSTQAVSDTALTNCCRQMDGMTCMHAKRGREELTDR